MSAIKVFLIHGGVEVVGETEGKSGVYQVRRPFRVMNVPVIQKGPQGLQINTVFQLVPFLPSTTQVTITLTDEDLIEGPMSPTKSTEDTYIQMTTGIQVAQ